jgi:hypothetical protein
VYELVGLLVEPELGFYVGVIMKQEQLQAHQMFDVLFVHVKNACISGDSRLQPHGRKGLRNLNGGTFHLVVSFTFSVLGWGETESTL